MAKELSSKPSELVQLGTPLSAFYFDRIVMQVGQQIEDEIETAQEKKKTAKGQAMAAQLVLNRWLRAEGGARYRDPAAR